MSKKTSSNKSPKSVSSKLNSHQVFRLKRSRNEAKTPVAVHNVTVEEEIADNEEVIFELNECLTAKENVLKDLETQAQKVEIDLKRYTTPYNCETGTLDEDISMFRTVASKYVKSELIDFYVDRMKKSASNSLDDEPSTISALCQLISDEQDV